MKSIKGLFPLHEDLGIEILLRLPVKSLLRFKTVSQRWHSIIRSPSFVRNHFRRENNSTGLLVYWDGEGCTRHENGREEVRFDYAISVFPDETLERYGSEVHREFPEPVLCVQGPYNGVFCVLLQDNTLSLWNPATRMLRAVPTCPLQGPTTMANCGFGSDTLTDDLKIVLFSLNFGIESERPQFAIYSLSDNSWRLFVEAALFDPHAYFLPKRFKCAFPNGFCYWIKRKSRTSLDFAILAFDMHNEVFREVEMPKITLESSVEREILLCKRELKLKLQWYDDSLALITYYQVAGQRCFDMWLMKEQGCWTKISTVSLSFEPYGAIGVWKKNNVLALTSDRKLMIHDTDSGKTRSIDFRKIENDSWARVVCAFPYKESLFPL